MPCRVKAIIHIAVRQTEVNRFCRHQIRFAALCVLEAEWDVDLLEIGAVVLSRIRAEVFHFTSANVPVINTNTMTTQRNIVSDAPLKNRLPIQIPAM